MQIHYLNGGSCRQLLASIDGRTLRFVRFHAVFLAFRHPRLGWVVCDTGYGDAFFAATRRWPSRLYRWATPVTLRRPAAALLDQIGCRATEVQWVIVTHFHADHIGGLAEFPQARVIHHESALAPLLRCSPFRQTRAAFLPGLVPPDLSGRSVVVGGADWAPDGELPFPTHDVFGDGSIKLVDLPGHAPGQIGLEYRSEGTRFLYCADAFWRSAQIEGGLNITRLAQALQWDRAAYALTIEKLRTVARTRTHRLLACHAEETQRYVTV